MSDVAGVILFLVLPIVGGLYGGDLLTERECWTPFRGIGAWNNERAARKTLRLLNATACFARDQSEDITP